MLDGADKVIVALDLSEKDSLELAEKLQGMACWMKVGMTLYYQCGPSIIKKLKDMGYKVFLDLKLHDIPHQIEGAAYAACMAGADILSIHGLGGKEMIQAARRGADKAEQKRGARTDIIAITVLTSMNQEALEAIGINDSVVDEVARLEKLAILNGTDGVVCSPQEATLVRSREGSDVLVVTPGVRPKGSILGDQSRVMTPADAIAAGASHIVVGRPITAAADPISAFKTVANEVAGVIK